MIFWQMASPILMPPFFIVKKRSNNFASFGLAIHAFSVTGSTSLKHAPPLKLFSAEIRPP
jgi:hypothetical protein